MKIWRASYFAGRKRIARSLIIVSLGMLLALIMIEILPLFVPSLRYSYTSGIGIPPPILADFPLPISGWQSLMLLTMPWIALFFFLVSLILIALEHTREQDLITYKPSATTAARDKQIYQQIIAGLCTLMVLSIILGLTEGNLAWAVAQPTGTSVILRQVAMVSPTEGWAVGGLEANNDHNNFGVIWHYSQGQWARTPTTLVREQLYGVTTLPNGDAWAVGAGATILHEHKGTWTLMPLAKGLDNFVYDLDNLYSILMVSSDEGWAVGGWATQSSDFFLGERENGSPGRYSTVFSHLKQRSTEVQPQSIGEVTLRDRPGYANLYLSPSIKHAPLTTNDTENNICLLLHYVHGLWSRIPCPLEASDEYGTLESLSRSPNGDIWIGSARGKILRNHAGIWTVTEVTSPSGPSPYDTISKIAMISETEGWIIVNGDLLHYQNGHVEQASIQGIADLQTPLFYGLALSSSGEGWAVGSGGWAHYRNGTWQFVKSSASLDSQTLLGVTSVPGHSNEFWSVGDINDQPLIFHENNGIWSISNT